MALSSHVGRFKAFLVQARMPSLSILILGWISLGICVQSSQSRDRGRDSFSVLDAEVICTLASISSRMLLMSLNSAGRHDNFFHLEKGAFISSWVIRRRAAVGKKENPIRANAATTS